MSPARSAVFTVFDKVYPPLCKGLRVDFLVKERAGAPRAGHGRSRAVEPKSKVALVQEGSDVGEAVRPPPRGVGEDLAGNGVAVTRPPIVGEHTSVARGLQAAGAEVSGHAAHCGVVNRPPESHPAIPSLRGGSRQSIVYCGGAGKEE